MDNYGGSADQLVIMQIVTYNSKRGVSYTHWESGDCALKPGNAEGKIK